MILEPGKKAFQETWPGGYTENFVVYEEVVGGKEKDIVSKCLEPFYDSGAVALEIGCGTGFWLGKYLIPHFKLSIGLDVIPREWVVAAGEYRYIEAPDRDYSCFQIEDNSVDFVWSFGCFCHLTIPSISKYLKSIVRVLRPGGKASLFFSNTERRPGTATQSTDGMDMEKNIIWVDNNWTVTQRLMEEAGFCKIKDLIPDLKDTIAFGMKE